MPAVLRGRAAHNYAELAVSSPDVPETVGASTNCAYLQRDGQAEWARLVWTNIGMVLSASARRWSPIPVLTGLDVA